MLYQTKKADGEMKSGYEIYKKPFLKPILDSKKFKKALRTILKNALKEIAKNDKS